MGRHGAGEGKPPTQQSSPDRLVAVALLLAVTPTEHANLRAEAAPWRSIRQAPPRAGSDIHPVWDRNTHGAFCQVSTGLYRLSPDNSRDAAGSGAPLLHRLGLSLRGHRRHEQWSSAMAFALNGKFVAEVISASRDDEYGASPRLRPASIRPRLLTMISRAFPPAVGRHRAGQPDDRAHLMWIFQGPGVRGFLGCSAARPSLGIFWSCFLQTDRLLVSTTGPNVRADEVSLQMSPRKRRGQPGFASSPQASWPRPTDPLAAGNSQWRGAGTLRPGD
jgi:hypothetical protein